MGFAIPATENKRKWKERQILGFSQRTENAVKYEGDSDTKCSWCTWNGPNTKPNQTKPKQLILKNQKCYHECTEKIIP